MAHTQTHRQTRWRALLVAMAATLVAIGAVAGTGPHEASAALGDGYYHKTYSDFGQLYEGTAVTSLEAGTNRHKIVFGAYLNFGYHGTVYVRLVGPGYVSTTYWTQYGSTGTTTHYCEPGEVYYLETWLVLAWTGGHHRLTVPCVPPNSSGSW